MTADVPSGSRSVSWIALTCVIFPRSSDSVCHLPPIFRLMSTCDQLPGIVGKPGTGAAALVAAVASIATKPTSTTSFRMDTLFLVPVIPGWNFGKSHVKRKPPALAGGSSLLPLESLALGRWASWHLPDHTRQCAFDLRFL